MYLLAKEASMPKDRSPGYPHINLEQALAKVAAIYTLTKGHATSPEEVHKGLGFSPNTGPAMKTTASIIQFGLLEAEGRGSSRKIRLSDLALRIVRDERGHSPERAAAMREAAKLPTIYQALAERFGLELPEPSVMETALKLDYGFTDKAAPVVTKKFLETLEFVDSLGDRGSSDGRPDAVDVDYVEWEGDAPVGQGLGATETDDRGQLVMTLEEGRIAFALSGKVNAYEADLIMKNVTAILKQRGSGSVRALPEESAG